MNDWFGDWNDAGWIIVYVIVALVVIGSLVAVGMRKKRQLDHQHAEAMRLNAKRQEPRLAQQEAETRRLEAESDEARAEADRREALARDQRERLERERSAYDDDLRQADKIDPRAKHRADGASEEGAGEAERHDVSR